MPFFPGSAAGGMAQGQQAGQSMQMQQQQLAQMLQSMAIQKQRADQQQQAYQTSLQGLKNQGAVLGDVYGQQQQAPMQFPPRDPYQSPLGQQFQAPPQQNPMVPPAAPQGASSPGGTPNGGPPPQQGMPPQPQAPDPWKSIPKPPQGAGGQGLNPQAAAQGSGMEQLGAPPAPPQAQGQMQGDVKNGVSQVPDPQDLMRKIVMAGKARGLPDEAIAQLVNDMAPQMNAMQKQRVDEFRAEVQGVLGAIRGQAAITQAGAAVTRAETGKKENLRKVTQGNDRIDQGDERLDQAQQRLDNRGAGGTGGGKKPSMGNYNQFLAQQEKMLKPIEDAQRQSQEIRGLIASGEPSSMTQVQKILSQYLQQGRMTNQMYGDNKSYGLVYERAANAISRFAQGDYSDKNKQIILDMINKMDKTVFSPARDRVVKLSKERLKKMGGDESIADRPATFGGDDGGRQPTFASKRQLEEAIAAKTVKKGDTFLDPDGNPHVVQ